MISDRTDGYQLFDKIPESRTGMISANHYLFPIPEFNGNDPQTWLSQANLYFKKSPMDTVEEWDTFEKVKYVRYFMFGPAEIWFEETFATEPKESWESFCEKVLHHFTNPPEKNEIDTCSETVQEMAKAAATEQLAGTVWKAGSALKKTSSTNVMAIGRAMTQVAVSVKDVLRELKELKKEEASEEMSEKLVDKSDISDYELCDEDLCDYDLWDEEMEFANLPVKLWPPTVFTRQSLVERMAKNLITPSIWSRKDGLLSPQEAEKNAKQIEEAAFEAVNQHFAKEPDGDGSSAVQLYAKEASKLMVDIIKRGPVTQAEEKTEILSKVKVADGNVFDISGDPRKLISAEESAILFKFLAEPGNKYSKICFGNTSFGRDAAIVAEPILSAIKNQLTEVDLSDFVAGREEVEALEVMKIFSLAREGCNLRYLNVSDNALGEKGVTAFEELFKSQQNLEELYLMNNGISEEAAALVCDLIPSSDKLRVLKFHNNMPGDKGAMLEYFQCSSTRIESEGGIAIAKALGAAGHPYSNWAANRAMVTGNFFHFLSSSTCHDNHLLNYSPSFSLPKSFIKCVLTAAAWDSIELNTEETGKETENQGDDKENENVRLYVGKFSFSMTSIQLSEILAEAGHVFCWIIMLKSYNRYCKAVIFYFVPHVVLGSWKQKICYKCKPNRGNQLVQGFLTNRKSVWLRLLTMEIVVGICSIKVCDKKLQLLRDISLRQVFKRLATVSHGSELVIAYFHQTSQDKWINSVVDPISEIINILGLGSYKLASNLELEKVLQYLAINLLAIDRNYNIRKDSWVSDEAEADGYSVKLRQKTDMLVKDHVSIALVLSGIDVTDPHSHRKCLHESTDNLPFTLLSTHVWDPGGGQSGKSQP